jgi:hypothetical protein
MTFDTGGLEETSMATSVKQMLEAANAAAPKILPAQATDMMAKGNTLTAAELARPLEAEAKGDFPP